MDRPQIVINVVGKAGAGKSSIVLLLNDFLEHTGFSTEINLLDDISDANLTEMFNVLPDKLDSIIEKDTHIIINEVQARRDNF